MGLPSEPVDFSQFEPKESLKDSIIKVLGAEDVISRALGISDSPWRCGKKHFYGRCKGHRSVDHGSWTDLRSDI